MKKIAIIGGGMAAKPIINKAIEVGVLPIVFGQKYCIDAKKSNIKLYEIDIFNIDKIYELCKKEKVDGVIATSEITTQVTAVLAKKLNLIGNIIFDDGCAFANKSLMREKLKNATYVKQPKFTYYSESLKINYPVVVKSVDSCGKKGITYVDNDNLLDSALEYARQNSNNDKILIEEYISNGKEYSVECISYRGINYIVQVTEKINSGPPHFSELAHHQPARNIDKSVIKNAIDEILLKTGIINGLSHVEIIIKNNDIYFVEVGARAGGDRIGDTLVGLSTNIDLYKMAIETSLGNFTTVNPRNIGYAGIYFLCNQTSYLEPLFKYAKGKKWCYEMFLSKQMIDKYTNDDGGKSSYFIYNSDHKITILDYLGDAKILNQMPNILNKLIDFSIESERKCELEFLKNGFKKFIKHGNIIGYELNGKIIAMGNLYCNNYNDLVAYINNVEVLKEYRGCGLSNSIVKLAIEIAKKNKFKKIKLHVEKSNYAAIELYKKNGFRFTEKMKNIDKKITCEMILEI